MFVFDALAESSSWFGSNLKQWTTKDMTQWYCRAGILWINIHMTSVNMQPHDMDVVNYFLWRSKLNIYEESYRNVNLAARKMKHTSYISSWDKLLIYYLVCRPEWRLEHRHPICLCSFYTRVCYYELLRIRGKFNNCKGFSMCQIISNDWFLACVKTN